ncbi:MAG: acyltransferase family protein [Clostridia bacterium]|nr:acyltransferase family protein [Clostridia bacterium]
MWLDYTTQRSVYQAKTILAAARYVLKLFASYMVVFIHIPFAGQMGIVMPTLARFAVPFFFLISGYFSYQISPEKIVKRIKNILTLYVFATVCYTLFGVMVQLLKGDIAGIITHFSQYADL